MIVIFIFLREREILITAPNATCCFKTLRRAAGPESFPPKPGPYWYAGRCVPIFV